LRKVANRQTNRQANNDENKTSLAEVILLGGGNYRSSFWSCY